MRQVVVLSTRSRDVPPEEQSPQRFLCLRDTCHVEVPEEVSFHFLKLACSENPQVFYLCGCSCVTVQRTFTTQRKWPYSLSYLILSKSNTKLTLIENKKGKSLETKLKPLVTFQSTGQLKRLKCGIREDLMRFKLNGGGHRQWRLHLQALFK